MADDAEVRYVAQAIANAFAKESGAAWYDYQDQARTMIAAYDAIHRLREDQALERNKVMVEAIRATAVETFDENAAQIQAMTTRPESTYTPPNHVETVVAEGGGATVTSIKSVKKGKAAKEAAPTP